MGAFLFSTKSIDTSKCESILKSRGHKSISCDTIGNAKLVHTNKVLIDNVNYLSEIELGVKGDFILGVGTYFYDNSFGGKALKKIYTNLEYIINANPIYGHYSFIVHKDGSTYIFTDLNGTLRLYYTVICDDLIISTSMLSIISIIEKPVFDKKKLSAFIAGGYSNDNPFVKGVENFEPRKLIIIKDGGKPIFKDREIPAVPHIEELDEAIPFVKGLFEQQLKQLKAIGEEKISIEMTAGLDSRLIASNLKTAGFNYDFVNYPLFGPDSEIAHLIANKLNKKIHILNNIPCTKEFDALYGEFDYCFDYFRQYPNQRWNIENRFQFSGARGECIDTPDIFSDDDSLFLMNTPNLDAILPVLTLRNGMTDICKKEYINYIKNVLVEKGFPADRDMTEKELNELCQVMSGQLTADYMYNSACQAHLYFYQIYNEWHFSHWIMDISFKAKTGRKLTLALISLIDPELGSFPFVSRRRTKRNSVNEVTELPMQYKSYNKMKSLLPKALLNKIYGRMGRMFSKDYLNQLDLSLYKDVVKIEEYKKYPNIYYIDLHRLFSIDVLRKKFNIAF